MATQKARLTMAGLPSMNFDDGASSVVVRSGSWQQGSDANFCGPCVTPSPGSYGSLCESGLNDCISSVRPAGYGDVGGNAVVELFEHADYRGRCITLGPAATATSATWD